MKLLCKTNAKINLSIDVLRRRDDGYHDVKMIMQSIDLHDVLIIEAVDGEGIELESPGNKIPTDEKIIAYQSAKMMIEKFNINKKIRIYIEKNIPVSAGLAGGSSNAAVTILALDKMFNLNIEKNELLRLGKSIGADVPFCMQGGTMLCEGIGDILTPVKPFYGVDVVLVKPYFGVSTPWVYSNLDLERVTEHPESESIIESINQGDVMGVCNQMGNVLETVTIKKFHKIDQLKKRMLKLGAIGSLMSGSGPTVFGIFNNADMARDAFECLQDEGNEVFIAKTVDKGSEISVI